MSSVILAISVCVLAQTPQLPPEEAKIYRIIFEDGTERYGAVEESGMQVKVYYDTPWAPQPPETIPRRKVQLEELTSALRKSRQREEAAKQGFELVTTDYGESWAPREEIDLADRARGMVLRQQEEEAALAAAATPPPPVTSELDSKKEEPRRIRQYAPHLIIAAAGLVLSAVVLKALVLAD